MKEEQHETDKESGRKSGAGVGDLFTLSRVNKVLYIFIALLAAFIVYFVVTEYMMLSEQLPKEALHAGITRNEVQSFEDGFHPVIVVDTSARQPSIIQIKLASAVYAVQQSSGEQVNNYTAFFVLPENTFATEFNMTVTATSKNGGVLTRRQTFITKENQEVLFKVG